MKIQQFQRTFKLIWSAIFFMTYLLFIPEENLGILPPIFWLSTYSIKKIPFILFTSLVICTHLLFFGVYLKYFAKNFQNLLFCTVGKIIIFHLILTQSFISPLWIALDILFTTYGIQDNSSWAKSFLQANLICATCNTFLLFLPVALNWNIPMTFFFAYITLTICEFTPAILNVEKRKKENDPFFWSLLKAEKPKIEQRNKESHIPKNF